MQDIPPTQFMDLRSFLAPAVACAVSACAVKLLHMSNEFGEQIVCNHPKNYHKYALDFYIFAMGSLCCFVTVQSLRVFSLNGKSERFDDVRRVAIAALTISIIQLGTTYSDYNNPLGCINSFGMVSGSAMWADWIVTLPLYLYTYITPNFGDPPSFVDGLSVVLSAIVVIGGFTMNISGVSPALATCIFTFNLVAFVGCCVCIYLSNNSPPLDISPEKAIMRRVLLLMFFFVMPIYPLVFFVSCLGIIESSMTAVLFNALGMLAKGLFGVIILDLDIRIFVRVEASLDVELKARQRRKDFLRYMFHELRIPLNAISMSAELSKQICSDPSAQYLREICEYAEFIDHALARYMRTEKIEDGTFELISNPFPLDVLWKQIDSFSVKYARNRDVRVIRNMRKCADLPRVLNGDVDMLILALENLICLAIHRTRIGGRLIVDIEDVSRDVDFNANNCRIGFHFEDFGEYMTDNQIDNIFIPFSSLMLGEISTNGYSSLGLFAAKEVLSRYDSAFFVRGKSDGSGIEYSFDICVPIGATIPLSTNNERIENKVRDVKFNDTVFSPQATPVIASTHSRPARARGINAGAEDKNTFSNLRILVVDDAGSNRKLLQRMLQQKGISSDGAENGQIAVDMAGTMPYDLIFMDFSMPVMNGVEATAEIRRLGYSCCIVAVTGNAVDDDVNAFFKAGVEHLVVKPMTSAKLDEVLGCFGEINKASASEKLKALSASEYAKNV